MVKISPSLLSADFSKLAEEIKSIEKSGAEMLHLDVMDGVFVPNISFGVPVISSIRKCTDMFFDTHLMIKEPEKYIDKFIDIGSDLITFHIEATEEPIRCIEMIKARGKMAAVSIKPATPAEAVYPFLELCDMILVMTVEPGFGGQSLIEECVAKVTKIKEEIRKRGLSTVIQVDGGIHSGNAGMLADAGADILVAGSAVFGKADRKAAVDSLR